MLLQILLLTLRELQALVTQQNIALRGTQAEIIAAKHPAITQALIMFRMVFPEETALIIHGTVRDLPAEHNIPIIIGA